MSHQKGINGWLLAWFKPETKKRKWGLLSPNINNKCNNSPKTKNGPILVKHDQNRDAVQSSITCFYSNDKKTKKTQKKIRIRAILTRKGRFGKRSSNDPFQVKLKPNGDYSPDGYSISSKSSQILLKIWLLKMAPSQNLISAWRRGQKSSKLVFQSALTQSQKKIFFCNDVQYDNEKCAILLRFGSSLIISGRFGPKW